MSGPDDLLLVSEAARLANLSGAQLRALADRGQLPVIRTASGQRLFRRADLEAFLEERKRNPPRIGRPPKKKATKIIEKKPNKKATSSRRAKTKQ